MIRHGLYRLRAQAYSLGPTIPLGICSRSTVPMAKIGREKARQQRRLKHQNPTNPISTRRPETVRPQRQPHQNPKSP
jgi:hypothetical protein